MAAVTPKVNYRLKINVINYVRGAGNRFEEGAGYNHISVWLPFCFRFHLAERILSENDCCAAREISNHLYWARDEVNSWTVPRMVLWLWHYYNRCLRGPRCYLFSHIKVWPFCSLFRRPSRENPFFEEQPKRRQSSGKFSKLKLKCFSHLHNTPPQITLPAWALGRDGAKRGRWGAEATEAKGFNNGTLKRKEFSSSDSVDHSAFIQRGQCV